MTERLIKKQKERATFLRRLLLASVVTSTLIGSSFIVARSAHAEIPTLQIGMLPPTPMGSTSVCPSGSNQILAYSGVAQVDNKGAGINCVPIAADGSGDLAAAGNVAAMGMVEVGSTTSTCTPALSGAIQYNKTSNQFVGCNGTAWVPFSGGYPINHPQITTSFDTWMPGPVQHSYACAGETDANGNIYLALFGDNGGQNLTGWQNTNHLEFVLETPEFEGSVVGGILFCSADVKGIYATMQKPGGYYGIGVGSVVFNHVVSW